MSTIRTLPAVTATSGTPTPVYSGPVVAAESFSIKSNIATIVLGAGNLPSTGYNGPAGGQNPGAGLGQGQQVTLWGFSTATYFNGKTVTVLDNDPTNGSFRFAFGNADVSSTADAGSTAPSPVDRFRTVRIECGQDNSTNIVFVGDLAVSSTRYAAALTLALQKAFAISGQNIDASRIFVDTDSTGTTVQVSLTE